MIKIFFSGTDATFQQLTTTLADYAELSKEDGDISFYELDSVESLKIVPQKSSDPVFAVITSQDKAISERLGAYKVSGIIIPPFSKDTIANKLAKFQKDAQTQDTSHFDVLRVKILAKAESIPTLPLYANKLLAMTGNASSSLKEITDLLKHDQSTSSRVIRMANSPFYGLRQDITSIDRAVVLLGYQTLRNIALVASTSIFYGKGFEMYNTTGDDLWDHVYKTAVISEMFAKACNMDPDDFFLAGLFHDIGKTVLVDFLVKEVNSCEDEREQLGVDHAEAAGMVLRRWQIPESIINIVSNHHNPQNDRKNLIVYHANIVSRMNLDDEEVISEYAPILFKDLPLNMGIFDKIKTFLATDIGF